MGWSYSHKPKGESVIDYFRRSGVLQWHNCEPWEFKVLAHATVRFRTFYAAVEKKNTETGEREVFAVVFLLNYAPADEYNFGYKGMDESMGPCESECPEKILKLLTPTTSGFAKEWRARCQERIDRKNARPKIRPGMTLRLGGKDYVVRGSIGRRGYDVECGGVIYRMKTTQAAVAEILG